jgi:hypothetical protein
MISLKKASASVGLSGGAWASGRIPARWIGDMLEMVSEHQTARSKITITHSGSAGSSNDAKGSGS